MSLESHHGSCSTALHPHATLPMALVSYSDSEGSGDEKPQTSTAKHNAATPTTTQPRTTFTTDRLNPRKIQVKLLETKVDASASNAGVPDEEPAPKRQRVERGAFSDFSSMLPAPKRDSQTHHGSDPAKGQPRKMFSLKTGAERGFDRDSDAELKQLFAEQHADVKTVDVNGVGALLGSSAWQPDTGSTSISTPSKTGNPIMFKPLSVARKPAKKRLSTNPVKETPTQTRPPAYPASEETPPPTPKVSLFSTATELPNPKQSAALIREYKPLVYDVEAEAAEPSPDFIGNETRSSGPGADIEYSDIQAPSAPSGPQSLDAVASDLNLSASARRQLFGRKSGAYNSTVNVINFNTEKEYAANEVLRASGEQIQHNPVRGPASGKHSLKQLVTMAAGQKDALEESFAAGRQNKKEAGSRYGW